MNGLTGAMAGVRVLEFCHFLAGPYGGLVLADLGADVVKVEDPHYPDEARAIGPHFLDGQSLYFLSLNWAKRSVGVHLSRPDGRAVVHDLVRQADVVLTNYRPGVLEKLGLALGDLREVNPRLVTCSLTAYGETGPDALLPGYDYTVQARAGVMSLSGEPEGPPTRAGIAYVDHAGGLGAALGVAAALLERHRTGRGRHVDASLLDIQTSMLTYLASWCLNAGENPSRIADSAHPTLVPAQNFRTADGHLVLFVGNDGMWSKLVQLLAEPRLADPRFATLGGRARHRGEVLDLLRPLLATDSTASWVERLSKAGVACAPVNDVAGALGESQVAFRQLIHDASHPVYGSYSHCVGPLPSLSARPQAGAPFLGEHTVDVLAEAGYSPERIEELARAGVVCRS